MNEHTRTHAKRVNMVEKRRAASQLVAIRKWGFTYRGWHAPLRAHCDRLGVSYVTAVKHLTNHPSDYDGALAKVRVRKAYGSRAEPLTKNPRYCDALLMLNAGFRNTQTLAANASEGEL